MGTCFFFKMVPKPARLRWLNKVRRMFGLSEISEVAPTPEIEEQHRRPANSDKVVSPDNLSIMFPRHELTEPDDGDREPKTCCICLDVIPVGSSIRALDCGHIFHSTCIASWLTKYRRQCPLCNHVIPKDTTQLEAAHSKSQLRPEIDNTHNSGLVQTETSESVQNSEPVHDGGEAETPLPPDAVHVQAETEPETMPTELQAAQPAEISLDQSAEAPHPPERAQLPAN